MFIYSNMSKNMSNTILIYKRYLRPVLFSFGFIFFVFFVFKSWQETYMIFRQINWTLFGFSVIIAIGDNIVFSLLFQQILLKYGFSLNYTQISQMYFLGQIAKYIPGSFWGVVYHSTFSSMPGTIKAMFAANVDLMVSGLLRNIFIAIALIFFFQKQWLALIPFIFGSIAFCYAVKSCLIAWIINLIFKYISLSLNKLISSASKISNAIIILISICTWVTFLTSNFLLMNAAFGFELKEASLYIGYFTVAWVIGVITFIVPAGIGIRELTFILLAQYFGQESLSIEFLTAIAVVYRFWIVCHEICGLGIGLVLKHFYKANQ